jgi:hypothetical protein
MGFFPAGTYDLFLTHAWSYTDEWQGLVGMLDEQVPGRWRNWSLPWHDTSIERHTPEGKAALIKLLNGQMSMASAILLLPETTKLPDGQMWLEQQLEIAARYEKPVIGILPPDDENRKFYQRRPGFPEHLKHRVNELVDRDAARILQCVDRLSLKAAQTARK